MANEAEESREQASPPVIGPVVGVMLGLITVKLLAGSVPVWALVPIVIVAVGGVTWASIQWSARRR